jgi:hypothetical protein
MYLASRFYDSQPIYIPLPAYPPPTDYFKAISDILYLSFCCYCMFVCSTRDWIQGLYLNHIPSPVFFETVSGWPETLNSPASASKCWDYKYTLPGPVYNFLYKYYSNESLKGKLKKKSITIMPLSKLKIISINPIIK